MMQHTVDLRKNSPEQELKHRKEVMPQGISWQAPSFYYNPQKKYLVTLIVGLLLGATVMLILNKDTLTAVFLILSSVVLILYATKKPQIKTIAIDRDGIHMGENSFLYEELKSFWIDYRPGQDKELSLESKKWYLPYVKISLEDRNPIEIRSWLMSFIPEKKHEKSVADLVNKRIGL